MADFRIHNGGKLAVFGRGQNSVLLEALLRQWLKSMGERLCPLELQGSLYCQRIVSPVNLAKSKDPQSWLPVLEI